MSPTATETVTPTVTETVTPDPAATPTDTPTVTGTPEPTYSPTVLPTSEIDWTATPTVTATPDPTVVDPTATVPPTATATSTAVPSGSPPYPIVQTSRSASTTSGTLAEDGDPTTVWQTAPDTDPGRTAVLTLDLGEPRTVDTVRLLAGPGGLMGSAVVETSTDGDHWTYFATPNPADVADDGWHTIVRDPNPLPMGSPVPLDDSGPPTARYVRIVFVNAGNDPLLGGVAEIQVWPPPDQGGGQTGP
jgi:hypothetical protein